MVDFHDMVAIKDDEVLDLTDYILYPVFWIYVHMHMSNMVLTMDINDILKHKFASYRYFGELILTLDGCDWGSTTLPNWAVLDLKDHHLHRLEVSGPMLNFKFPLKEGGWSDVKQVYNKIYRWEDATLKYNTGSATEEREQNMILYNTLIRRRFPMRLKDDTAGKRKISVSIPVEVE